MLGDLVTVVVPTWIVVEAAFRKRETNCRKEHGGKTRTGMNLYMLKTEGSNGRDCILPTEPCRSSCDEGQGEKKRAIGTTELC